MREENSQQERHSIIGLVAKLHRVLNPYFTRHFFRRIGGNANLSFCYDRFSVLVADVNRKTLNCIEFFRRISWKIYRKKRIVRLLGTELEFKNLQQLFVCDLLNSQY